MSTTEPGEQAVKHSPQTLRHSHQLPQQLTLKDTPPPLSKTTPNLFLLQIQTTKRSTSDVYFRVHKRPSMMQAGDDGALISNCLWESIDTNLEIARQITLHAFYSRSFKLEGCK
ncbi:hypothetical protein PVAP13_1NG335319 [Panicum virgatum]|uniref:Uncharacterized protein n=1 Tax=Panicum virgatum TaxID=38727 RepID=A0A8T0WY92_PANVG|nr:hypothetical protein PVAP13_1NG335319 [Panicum virgatum]